MKEKNYGQVEFLDLKNDRKKLRRIKLSGGKDSIVNKNTKSSQMKSRQQVKSPKKFLHSSSFNLVKVALGSLRCPNPHPFMQIVSETTETESANL